MNNDRFYSPSDLYPKKLNKKTTDDDKICHIKFCYCHNKYPLEKLCSKDLKTLISFFQKIEVMTWTAIKIDTGLNYETPTHFNDPMPSLFPVDATAISMRVNKKFRIIGWRESQYLNIMWFDKNHVSYPG